MKNLLYTLTVLFTTTQLFACPDLDGDYTCTTYEPQYDITIENQELSIRQDENSYTIDNDLVLITDEVFHRGAFGIRHKTSCDLEKNILLIELKTMFVKAYLEYVPTEDGLIVYRTTKQQNKYISHECVRL